MRRGPPPTSAPWRQARHPWNQKRETLSQEIVRRLQTTSEELPHEEKVKILETFIRKLKLSGYSRDQARDITRSGIFGYKRKWEMMPNRHRRGVETETSRRRKKLTGKTTWYLDKQTQGED